MKSIYRIVLLLGALALASPAAAELTAGAAKLSLVPPFPTTMGGFGDRTDTFTGVRDELFVRALALSNEESTVILVGSGLMALDRQLVHRAKLIIETQTGVTPGHVLISCAHNHSAPYGYQRLPEGETNPTLDFMVEQFSAAAIAAYEAREPARLGSGVGELAGATRNRQQDNDEVLDTQVGVLRVEKLEGREIIAHLFNYTAHPVILGSENLELSGEFPGWACRTVESVMGGVAIFTQGACGDVTVHRSGDPWLEIQRVGRMLAGEVIRVSESIRCESEARISAGFSEIRLFNRDVPPGDSTENVLARERAALERVQEEGGDNVRERERVIQQRIRLHEGNLRLARTVAEEGSTEQKRYIGSAQVIQTGNLVMIAIPGELFVDYALEMRRRIAQMTGKNMILVGYANDYIGYIITPRALRTGGYEAAVARVDENAGRMMTEVAMRIAALIVR